MATLEQWYLGARPRTLPAAVVPVVVASAAAASVAKFDVVRAGLALVVSLSLQIGTNFSNDYSDGLKGTDDKRVGPMRLTASKLARPKQVLLAGMIFFAIAALAGLVLAWLTTWMLLIGGFAALAAGWYYTGGKRPYGYYGFGELFVFVFFGVFAVMGTYYVQVQHLDTLIALLSLPVGFLAVALLVVNNLRDIRSDTAAKKITLAVRLGDKNTRRLYEGLVIAAFIVLVPAALYKSWVVVGAIALIWAYTPIKSVASGATGPELIKVLGATGRLQIAFGIALTTGLLL